MNKKTKFSLFVFLILISTVSAKAYSVSTSDLDYHGPAQQPCFGCHLTNNFPVGGSDHCGNCHDYGLNIGKLESDHNPKICKACHIGNTIVNATDKEIFHNGHNAVKCTQCHTEDNFTVIKIQAKGFVCVSCHGNQVHRIHIKNLEKVCPTCHGQWGIGKVYIAKTSSPSNNEKLDSEKKRNAKLENFTIFSFIKNLIDVITGVNK
jgi:hypothetical protein